MKRFNRLWALLLAFALMITYMPAMAFAEGDMASKSAEDASISFDEDNPAEIWSDDEYDFTFTTDGLDDVEGYSIEYSVGVDNEPYGPIMLDAGWAPLEDGRTGVHIDGDEIWEAANNAVYEENKASNYYIFVSAEAFLDGESLCEDAKWIEVKLVGEEEPVKFSVVDVDTGQNAYLDDLSAGGSITVRCSMQRRASDTHEWVVIEDAEYDFEATGSLSVTKDEADVFTISRTSDEEGSVEFYASYTDSSGETATSNASFYVGDDPGDSWYFLNDYEEVPFDPEEDEYVTLECKIVNGENYDLTYEWYSIEYDEEGVMSETLLEGESGVTVTVDAISGEYKCTVIDNDTGREDSIFFSVYEYSGGGDDESNVESIEYTPIKRIELLENTKGYEYQPYEDSEPFWLYNDYSQSFSKEGDTIQVTYKDGTEKTFVYRYDRNEENWCYVSEDGSTIYDGDLSVDDDQAEEGGWTIGENYFRISYEGASCTVPIYIVKNTVTKIEYEFSNHLEFIENVDCWEEDDGSLRYKCEWSEGDILTVYTEENPEGKAYTLKEKVRPSGQELWFEAADGSIIDSDDVRVYDNQDEVQWSKDDNSNNIVTVTYAGKTFTALATLVDQVYEYFDESYEMLLDEYYYFQKTDNEIFYMSMDGWDYDYFDVLEVTPADPEDSRFSIEGNDEGWSVIPKEAGTFSVLVRHTTIDGGEATDTVQITFLEERATVNVDRNDSIISNRTVLPGQSADLRATGHYHYVYKDSDGEFIGNYIDDDEDTNTGFTYKWVFCDEDFNSYATIESPNARETKVTVKKLDPEMLDEEVVISVKAVLYRNGEKLAESEDFEINISDYYYSIEPETINEYLAPKTKTKFSPKLYKYSYSFSDSKVNKIDCKAEFELDYDEDEFKVTDINNQTVTDYSAGPFYITRLTDDDCQLEISGYGEGTPSIGYSYTFDPVISIKNAKVKIADVTFNGKAQTPKPSVKVYDEDCDEWRTLSSKNYTVTYKDNKNVGKATVTIKGKGEYYGSVTASFKVNPKGTKLSRLTAAKKAFTAKWSKQSAKMTKSRITGYEIQYSTSSKFTTKTTKKVSVKGYSTTSKKVTKLKAKKTYYVRVRTYTKIGKVTYVSPWSSAKKVKTK